MEKKKIIKEYEGKKIYLVDARKTVRNGVRYKNSFWRTLDDKDHFEFECKIPYKEKDIDLKTLSIDCISGQREIKTV